MMDLVKEIFRYTPLLYVKVLLRGEIGDGLDCNFTVVSRLVMIS